MLKTGLDFRYFAMESRMPLNLSFEEQNDESLRLQIIYVTLETAQEWVEAVAVYHNMRRTKRDLTEEQVQPVRKLEYSFSEILNGLSASNRVTSEEKSKWHVVHFFELPNGFERLLTLA